MQKFEFKCPLCGHNEYGEKGFIGGFEFPRVVEYYYCKGCTVVFRDIDKFSALAKKEKKEES